METPIFLIISKVSLSSYAATSVKPVLRISNQNCLFRRASESNDDCGNYEGNESNPTRTSLTDTFKYHYFYNMTENFGNNDVGSCGYVAMAMLLSYNAINVGKGR